MKNVKLEPLNQSKFDVLKNKQMLNLTGGESFGDLNTATCYSDGSNANDGRDTID